MGDLRGPGEDGALTRLLAAALGVEVDPKRLTSLAAEQRQHLERADRLRVLLRPEDEPGYLDLRQ